MAPVHDLPSPLPGVFYRAPAPGAAPFKQEGDAVALGEVIGIVEVMKQFSEVTSEVAGRVLRFLVEDGEMVQAGQALAQLEARQ